MIKGLYTAASGMLAAKTQSEVIADNVANLRTPGYKVEVSSNKAFPELLMSRIRTENEHNGLTPDRTIIGTMGSGVVVDEITRMNHPGALQSTERPTDLAITSEAYFVVQTPNGERFTRNGQFQLNALGILQTSDGYPVLGQGGVIGPLSKDFTVDSFGVIRDNGEYVDQLRLVQADPNDLVREGQSLFNAQGPVEEYNGDGGIRQGFIESSNVDLTGQMVKMITVMRAYEANQKVIQTQDATLEKAVNEIGRLV